MLSLFAIILYCFAAFYVLVLSMLIHGLSRLRQGNNPDQPYISVIIAARNEEKNLDSCLNAFITQNYPQNRYEIIVVNDRSEDGTPEIIARYVDRDSHFRMLDIKKSNPDMAPKKWAVHCGIESARGEIILVTDADCVVNPGWIRAMARYFEKDVGLVAGYSPLDRFPATSVLYNLVCLDGLALAGVAAGSFGWEFPLTCNGRNLAYRKSVYETVGGFRSIGRFVSGDDDLFLHLVCQKKRWKMKYSIDRESMVSSIPPKTLNAFFNQRTRHASKGRHYPFSITIGLIATYLFNLMLMISLFFPRLWSLFFIVFLVKSLFEFILIFQMAKIFGKERLLWFFPVGMIVHIFYVVFFGFWGQIGRFRWKGDPFSRKMKEMNSAVIESKEKK